MSNATIETWEYVRTLVEGLTKEKIPENIHFNKLRGDEAKPAVVDGATARLLMIDAIFPYATRLRLNPKTFGNITLYNVDPTAWAAWIIVHRNYIESGKFWREPMTEAVRALIFRALDAERQAFIKATEFTGGGVGGTFKPLPSEQVYDLDRHTDFGDAWSTEPSREIERKERKRAERAALDYRVRLDEAENTWLLEAVTEYMLTLKKTRHKNVVREIIADPRLRAGDIAARTGAGEPKIREIRGRLDEMAERLLTVASQDYVAPATAEPDLAPDETLTQITNTSTESSAPQADEMEKRGRYKDAAPTDMNLRTAAIHNGAMDMLSGLNAPEISGDDINENAMRSYAQAKKIGRLVGDYERRATFDTAEMREMSGGGRKATYAERIQMSETSFDKRVQQADNRYVETAARYLQRKAREDGHNVEETLRVLDERIAQKTRDAKIAKAEVSALKAMRRVEILKSETPPEAAWVGPWCERNRFSVDELLAGVLVSKRGVQ